MKLPEFRELCDREWGEARGDVISLALTDESYEELTRDVIMDGGRSVPTPILYLIDEADLEGIRDGESFPPLLNPVTRSPVKLTKGASIDSAEVTRHYARAMDA